MQPDGTHDDRSTVHRGAQSQPDAQTHPDDEPTQAAPAYYEPSPQYPPAQYPPAQYPPTQPPPDPPDGPDTVREHLRRTKRGPLRRFTLYASGVDTRVLHYAPIEESEYVVQGTMVILTAIVASVSALAASSFLIAGHLTLTPLTIAIGLAWGTMIFFFDRALVSGSFNPYHFTEDEVRSLADRRVGTPWAHVATRKQTGGRGKEFLRVLAVGSLRVALALATSYIVADMVLFLVFQPEVNARAAFLQQELQAQRIAAIQADFADENAQRAAQRRELTGASDPEAVRLTEQVTTLTAQVDAARKDLGILQAAAAAELDGDKYTGTLSDGTTVTTTCKRGNGAAAQSLAQRRNTQQATVNDLQKRLDRARTALDTRLAELKDANAAGLATLEALDNKSAADQEAALKAAVADTSVVNGLLLRKNALSNLEYDAKPETLVKDEVAPCTGLFAWLCELRNAIVPPTPMGPTVLAYRLIFFFIEIMPITFKMINSLRRRRPYEVAKAALEEATHIDAFRLVDRHLYDASKEVSTRAYERKAWRESWVGEPEPLISEPEPETPNGSVGPGEPAVPPQHRHGEYDAEADDGVDRAYPPGTYASSADPQHEGDDPYDRDAGYDRDARHDGDAGHDGDGGTARHRSDDRYDGADRYDDGADDPDDPRPKRGESVYAEPR